jgi:hypothetical protein
VIVASRILNSKKDEWKLSWRERKEYIERIARYEGAEGIDDKLSAPLNDQNFQNLAYAMRVHLHLGKLGFYHREPFEMKNVQYKAVESYLFAPQMNSSSPPQNMPYAGRYLSSDASQKFCLLGPPVSARV